MTNAPKTPAQVRQRLVDALRLDLVGPSSGNGDLAEKLPGWVRPSNWYLTGFLVPTGAPPEERSDLDAAEDVDAVPDQDGLAEESVEDRKAAKPSFYPASMG